MAEMLYGGAGHFRAYRLKKNTNTPPDGYLIVQADGTTAATTYAHVSLVMDGYIEESNLAPQSDGTFKGTINNYDVADAIIDALNIFAKKPAAAAGTAPAGVFMEHGVEQGGSEGTLAPLFLWMSAGPKNGANTMRLTHWGIARADLNSGAIVFKNGQWIKPVLSINSIAAEWALTIPTALWGTLLWDGTTIGSITVPQYAHYMRDFLAKGTA